jgi:dTDP-4-amino-4,6-dideoxygalactose transaminase
MKFRLIPRLRPCINHREVLSALNFFSKGNIEKFERKFAEQFECQHGVMFQHGRSSLYALFKVWNLKDAEIICPAYSCVVVAHSIVLSGNIPVFVDCAKNSPNMDYQEIKNAINEKTRAIIVTHLFGYPMDVLKINDLVVQAKNSYHQKIYVIQDAAHSFGARWNDRLVTKYGDASIFGLNVSKTITSIFGGMVLTNDTDTFNDLKKFQHSKLTKSGGLKTLSRILYLITIYIAFDPFIYSLVNKLEKLNLLNYFVKYYSDDKIYFPGNWNKKPSEIEARVGLVQLTKYSHIIEQRTKNARAWMEQLKNDQNIQFFNHIEGSTYSHCIALVNNRDEWLKRYRKKGIQLGILIEYSIPYMQAYRKYASKEYPVSKYYSDHTINFPIWVK